MFVKCPRISSDEKRARQDHDERDIHPPLSSASETDKNQLNEDTKGKDGDAKELGMLSKYKTGQSSEPNLTWVHVAPILSPRKACPSHEGTMLAGRHENQPFSAVLPPSRQGSPATQDSSISSTTPYRVPKNLKKPVRCQSQPVAGKQSEGENIQTSQGQNQSLHVTLQPLSRVCSTPLRDRIH